MISGSVRQRHLTGCPRRPDGEWTSHRCKGTWQYVIELNRDGSRQRRQLTKAGFTSRREASAALQEALHGLRKGIDVSSRTTVGDYLESWLDAKRKLRPSTAKSYEQHVRLYLKPLLGGVALRELGPGHIDLLFAALSKPRKPRPLSTATIRRIHSTLRVALNDAVRRRVLHYNPAQYIELPPEPSSARTVWTPKQAARFLSASRDDPLFAAYHLALVTGMRRGEVCGLRWVDVDLDRSQVRVCQAAVQVGGTIHIGPPKTRSGLRTIALDAGTVGVLRRQQLEQASLRAQWAVAGEGGLVFSRPDGSVLSPERLSRKFKEATVAAGLPVIRFHDLRHTSASLALAAGVALKTVSGRLGHSTTAITADLYTHISEAVGRDAAEAIARSVENASGDLLVTLEAPAQDNHDSSKKGD